MHYFDVAAAELPMIGVGQEQGNGSESHLRFHHDLGVIDIAGKGSMGIVLPDGKAIEGEARNARERQRQYQ
jgi:hypothetical protein